MSSTIETVAGIKRNDPECTSFSLDYPWSETDYFPENPHEWEELGRAIGGNTHLEEVEVKFTSVHHELGNVAGVVVPPASSFALFCQGLSLNGSLKRLVIGISDFDLVDSGIIEILVRFLEANGNLRELDLKHTNLAQKGGQLLRSALARRTDKSLEKIILSHTNIYLGEEYEQGEYVPSLPSALKGYDDLSVLGLQSNFMGHGLTPLLSLLESPESKLKELDVGDTWIGNNGLKKLTESLAGNSVLKKLYIGRDSSITSAGWAPLLSLLQNSSCNLESLRLSGNNVNDSVASDIAESLASNEKLVDLDLSLNSAITSSGFMTISTLLQSPTARLACMNLSHSVAFDDDAASSLADAVISNNGTLKTLLLGFNSRVTTRGFRALSAMLQNASCDLESLDIYGCNIDEDSAVAFATALVNNRKLKKLNLVRNPTSMVVEAFKNLLCDPGDMSDINSIYSSNHTLEDLRYCRVSREIGNLLALNRTGYGCRAKILAFHFTGNFSMDPLAECPANTESSHLAQELIKILDPVHNGLVFIVRLLESFQYNLVDVLHWFGQFNLCPPTLLYGQAALFHVLRSQPSLFGWLDEARAQSTAGVRRPMLCDGGNASKRTRL